MKTAHLAWLPLLLLPFCTSGNAAPHVAIVPGVAADGQATALWLAMLRKRLSNDAFRNVESLHRPFTAEERAWLALAQARASLWQAEVARLAQPFSPLPPPEARIVLGNRGGDDAFTHDAHTIGFDLARLHALYGDASSAANIARIDRFFRHEYTHLLQKAWLAQHPVPLDSPFELALAELWTEGLGNWYSLSDSWRTLRAVPAGKTQETLQALAPRFVARLAALACTSPRNGALLTADLSRGPFTQKWGALTVALWLEQEHARSPDALREFVLAGPLGVLELAARHLAAELAAVLREALAAFTLCK